MPFFLVAGLVGLWASYAYGAQRGAAWAGVLVGLYVLWRFLRWPTELLAHHRELARDRVRSAREGDLDATDHTRVVELPVPAAAAYDLAIAWLRKSIMGIRFRETDRERGVIRARTWDTRIRVDVAPIDGMSSRAKVRSHARRLQLLDDGKNLGNVVELEAWLREAAARTATIDGAREPLSGG